MRGRAARGQEQPVAVAQVLATVRSRVGRLLAGRQLEPEDDSAPPDPLSETSPVLLSMLPLPPGAGLPPAPKPHPSAGIPPPAS